MSEPPFLPPVVPLVTPERARDIARGLQAMAAQFEDVGYMSEGRRMARDAQWWLTYAVTLAQTEKPPE